MSRSKASLAWRPWERSVLPFTGTPTLNTTRYVLTTYASGALLQNYSAFPAGPLPAAIELVALPCAGERSETSTWPVWGPVVVGDAIQRVCGSLDADEPDTPRCESHLRLV